MSRSRRAQKSSLGGFYRWVEVTCTLTYIQGPAYINQYTGTFVTRPKSELFA